MPEDVHPVGRAPTTEERAPRGHHRRPDAAGRTRRAGRLRPGLAGSLRARGGADQVRAGGSGPALEHVGSTSVPGLAAKPIIDIVLAVADSADEAAYVPPMEAAGYVLRIREPDWHEHRLFKGPDTNVNLHVFSGRDQRDVRAHAALIPTDRRRTSRAELAERRAYANYADAKIVERWAPATVWLTHGYADAKGTIERRRSLARAAHPDGLDVARTQGTARSAGRTTLFASGATRWARFAPGQPRPSRRATVATGRVDIERGSGYRPRTHMNRFFYFRCPA